MIYARCEAGLDSSAVLDNNMHEQITSYENKNILGGVICNRKQYSNFWQSCYYRLKVINFVLVIVLFFHYNETYRIYVLVYRVYIVLNFKK